MSLDGKQEVLDEAERLAGRGGDLRDEVRRLVLAALLRREADPQAIREVMRATVEGLGSGFSAHAEHAGASLKTAVHGLDEAVGKGVHALQLALEEAWAEGRAFSETDLRMAYEAVKGLDDDMVGTLKETGSRAKGVVGDEFARLRDHLAHTGGDTASQVKATLATLTRRMGEVGKASAQDARNDAGEAGKRLGAVASGILRGLADVLDKKTEA